MNKTIQSQDRKEGDDKGVHKYQDDVINVAMGDPSRGGGLPRPISQEFWL